MRRCPRFGAGQPAVAALAELTERGLETAVVLHDGQAVGLIGPQDLHAVLRAAGAAR